MMMAVVIAMADVHAPEIARGPIILGMMLMPLAGDAYIAIARRLVDLAESALIFAASGAAHVSAASLAVRAMRSSQLVSIADRARRALGLARAAHRAALDALRAAARVSHVAIAPRMTSRALDVAA
jgi:hypothetical protein